MYVRIAVLSLLGYISLPVGSLAQLRLVALVPSVSSGGLLLPLSVQSLLAQAHQTP